MNQDQLAKIQLKKWASLTMPNQLSNLVDTYKEKLSCQLQKLQTNKQRTNWKWNQVKNCIFIGHKNTDTDSVASAIGAAFLYNGIPALASEINEETKFALEYFQLPIPKHFAQIWQTLQQNSEKDNWRICLLDHNQKDQICDDVPINKIQAILDHHAIQKGAVITQTPIWVDIRPWGSTCSLITNCFIKEQVLIEKNIAGILLAGILSDTLNLKSPTTTDHDKYLVALLQECSQLKDINKFASNLFKAKAKILHQISIPQLVLGDFKIFELHGGFKLGISVIESPDIGFLSENKIKMQQIIIEMKTIKREENLDLMFLFAVNIVELYSKIFICGLNERQLAKLLFNESIGTQEIVADCGKKVSRKLDFLPPIALKLLEGWTPNQNDIENPDEIMGPLELDHHSSECCNFIRQKSIIQT